MIRLGALLVPLLLALPAAAAEVRFGVFVGNNEGASSELPLVFAVSDAKKMRDLFVEYGDMRNSDATLLIEAPRRQVETSLKQLHSKIAHAQANGDHTTVVFYYSGHGDDAALHLGPTRIGHEELRDWIDGTGADVMKRIAAPMVGGLVTSFALELLVYPALFAVWRGGGLPEAAPLPSTEDNESKPTAPEPGPEKEQP